ncbi:MAG: glutamate synthase subunit alpha, partial [Gammaproteobacteria bacterium]|nr:glutamate synthase subunit alpha [Gammaproteobacteria bacterium]
MTAQNGSLPGRRNFGLPPKQGLYDPALEKDSCGIGFVCDIKGRQSRGVVKDALGMNCSMEHRGGIGYEKNTGDGAGILLGLPDRFLRRAAAEELGVELPARGHYGVGNVFLPTDAKERDRCLELLEREIESAGQQFLGWRELPIDPDGADIGKAARAAMPQMTQLFVGASDGLDEDEFERKLYLIRKHATHLLRGDESLAQRQLLYICSLSSKVII